MKNSSSIHRNCAEGVNTIFRPSAVLAVVFLGFMLALPALAQINVAGTLQINLRAQDYSGTVWTNYGADTGNFTKVGSPSLVTQSGYPAMSFDGTSAYFVGPLAVADIAGASDRSIEVWTYNPAIAPEETLVAWSRRFLGNGQNMSMNYGSSFGTGGFGAAGHWGSGWDVGWGTGAAPAAGTWHHIAYVYNGANNVVVYVDGVVNTNQTMTGALNSYTNLAVTIGAQHENATAYSFLYSGYINSVRVHGGQLSAANVLANYTAGPMVSGVWTANADGNWSDITKWSANAVPQNAYADFSTLDITTERVVTLDSSKVVNRMVFGDTSGAQNWTLSGGANTLTFLALPTAATIQVNQNTATINTILAGANGFSKTGAGTLVLNRANTYTGNTHVKAGTLTIDSGGSVNNTVFSSIGQTTGDTGTLRVQGTGSYIIAADLNVSDVTGTTGIVHMTGGTFRGNTLYVGKAGTAQGYVVQSGGEVSRNSGTGEWRIGGGSSGQTGAVGIWDLSGGFVNGGAGSFQIGAYGSGQMNMSGGTFSNNSWTAVGRFSVSGVNGFGVLDVTGGNFSAINPGTRLMCPEDGTGNVNVRGGTVTILSSATGNAVTIGNTATGVGVVNLISGTLNTLSVGTGNASANSTINFNGGTLQARANNTTFMSGLTRALVRPGGAVVDSQSYAVTIGQALQAPTGKGVASVSLSSGGSGYITAPIVKITGGDGSGATAVATMSGGAVTGIIITSPGINYTYPPIATLVGGGYTTPAIVGGVVLAANASGGLTKVGTGTLTLSALNTFAGNSVISQGALALGAAGSISNSPQISLAAGTAFDVSAVSSFALNAAIGQRLTGSGVVTGSVVAASGAQISPGASAGTLSFSNNLTLSGGVTNYIELADVLTEGSGINDEIIVAGTLNLSGLNTIAVTPLAGKLANGRYTIIRYTGLTGNKDNLSVIFTTPQPWPTVSIDDTVTGEIALVVTRKTYLTTPVVTNITSTTAGMAGRVGDDAGNGIDQYGVLYDVTPAPTANPITWNVPATAPLDFGTALASLSPATHYYLRTWASNAVEGLVYSPEVDFYTRPDAASAVSFSAVGNNGMTVSWSPPATYDGFLVIVREGSAVAATPVDGTTYSANSIYERGQNMGGGQYVVHAGAATSVTLSSLLPGTTYHVSVCAYAGSGSLRKYQSAPATGNQATANTLGSLTVAGELLIDVNTARGVETSGGSVVTWTNYGTVGGYFTNPAAFTPPAFGPVVSVPAVSFNGNQALRASFAAPSQITGVDGSGRFNDHTVELWMLNPAIATEEWAFAWTRGGVADQSSGISYGNHGTWGATAHWSGGDMGYDGGVPQGWLWHHIVVTYDGATEKVYVDGVLNAQEAKNLNLIPNDPVTLGGTYMATPDAWRTGVLYSGSVASLRVHSRSLAAAQVANNFQTGPQVPGPMVTTLVPKTVTPTYARLQGWVLGTNGQPTTVRVYWGATDGGTVIGNWTGSVDLGVQGLGVQSVRVEGLNPNSTYFYRYYATNLVGEGWAGNSASFTTPPLFNQAGYLRNLQVTVNGYGRAETLTNFPTLLVLNTNLTGFSYDQFQSGSADLRLVEPGGGELNYEIESWDTNGNSYVWAQVPELTNGTVLQMFWSKPGATTPACVTNGTAWNDGFAGVWHMTNALNPSSVSTNWNITATVGTTVNSNGVIGVAQNYAPTAYGTAPYLNMPSNVTLSAWVWCNTLNVDHHFLGKPNGFVLWSTTTGTLRWEINPWGGDVAATLPGINQWIHVAGTWDGRTQVLYVNGTPATAWAKSVVPSITQDVMSFGTWPTTTRPHNGNLDECRLEPVTRSTNWIYACWKNQSTPAQFVSFSAVADLSAPLEVTLPTVTGVGKIVANLGARVASDAASGVTSWGTVWDTVPTPAANSLGIVGLKYAPFSFTHLQSGMTPGTHYYFRGWASNAAEGLKFTATDGEFYTKPEAASTVMFSAVGNNSVTLNWTAPAAYQGFVVVAREGSAVTATLTDGTTYTANPILERGQNLGGAQYVVYAGSGASATITGLRPATTCHVAVFAYSGTGGMTAYQSDPAATGSQLTADGLTGLSIAGDLVIDMDVTRGFQTNEFGVVTNWNNYGSAGGYFAPSGGTNGPFAVVAGSLPSAGFFGTNRLVASFNAPSAITGVDALGQPDDYTVEMWVLNPAIAAEEWVFSWAQRGSVGRCAAIGYGNNATYGVLGQWGAPDMGFDGGVPVAGVWHHIVATYSGVTNNVYVDGVFNATENKSLNLWDGGPCVLGDQYATASPLAFANLGYSGSLTALRVHSRALTATQVVNNYLAGPLLPTGPVSFLVQPQSATVLEYGQATFTALAGGEPPISYQWLSNNVPVAGANGKTLAVPNVLQANSGDQFSVVCSNYTGGVGYNTTSSVATLTVIGLRDALVHRYPFNGDARDTVGTAHGMLMNTANIASNAVSLDGASGYVDLPNDLFTNLNSLTFEAWATDLGSANWARLWDFGNSVLGEGQQGGGTSYMFLAWPSGGVGGTTVRGAYKTAAGAEQLIDVGPRPSQNLRHHILWSQDAASLTARLYIDGVLIGQNTAFSYTPASIGTTFNDWLGRAQFNDPYFRGTIDEFRIYNVALNPTMVSVTYSNGPDAYGPAQVLVPPQDVTVSELNGSAAFSFYAGGTPPLSYQWYSNDVAVAGATSPTLALSGLTGADSGGTFYCTVSNYDNATACTATSAVATLTVLPVQAGLYHRYSFASDGRDSIGTAHGTLVGGASVAGGALVLNGTNGYMELPGGIITGYTNLTVQFWAAFQTNNPWTRVFDFGNTNNGLGENYIMFSPHDGAAGNRFTLLTGSGVNEPFAAPSLNGRSVHVACVYDVTNNLMTIYTNGAFEASVPVTIPLTEVNNVYSFIGRSLFSSDPFLRASIDELRIYPVALTADQIQLAQVLGPNEVLVDAVQFITQPQSRSVGEGAPVSFSVMVNGRPPFTYQWYRYNPDGPHQLLEGATGASYTIPRALVSDNGKEFYCVASNVVNGTEYSATSTIAGLEVREMGLAHWLPIYDNDATDFLGGSHGTLMGAAYFTNNNSIVLDGSPGTYVDLGGGILTGLRTVTFEFWAAFGAQSGNWARVFDLGNINGAAGEDYIFFTPRDFWGNHQFAIRRNTGGIVDNYVSVAGSMEGRSVHVACVYDPTNNIMSLYTNGVLEGTAPVTLPLSVVNNVYSFLGRSLFGPDAWLNAQIHEFRIYDSALSAARILQSYQMGENLPVGYGGTPIDDGSLIVLEAPPLDTAADLLSTVVLSARAVGEWGEPVSYQWYAPTGLIAGATGRTLTLSGVTAVHAGLYVVAMTNITTGVGTEYPTTLTVLQSTLTGTVTLDSYAGAARDGIGTRDVLFSYTDGATYTNQVVQTLDFAGGSASYTLIVPQATIRASAKTAWTLRKTVSALLPPAPVANFVLAGGDLNGSDFVDIEDYFQLAAAWYTNDAAADIDGSGLVEMDDYFLLASSWYLGGDSE